MIIRFLRTEDGKCPAEGFLDGLVPKDAKKVLWVFRLIERLDRVPRTYLRKLPGTEEIWEIRIQGTRQIYRVLCFAQHADLWVMHGYSKKSRRTDAQQIARAERMRRDFIASQGDKRHV
jgi:phage-related protein